MLDLKTRENGRFNKQFSNFSYFQNYKAKSSIKTQLQRDPNKNYKKLHPKWQQKIKQKNP